jgi:high-affinity Fe2+/Pb2+ permease
MASRSLTNPRRLSWLLAFGLLVALAVLLYAVTGDPSLLNGVIGGVGFFAVLLALSLLHRRRGRS